MRLMPGSSARSETAARTESTRSAMKGGLSGRNGFRVGGRSAVFVGIGCVGDGVEDGGERGVAYRETGGGRHEIEVAGGRDGEGVGGGRVILNRIVGDRVIGGRGDGVLGDRS